jgi:hypothetical protein
MLLIALRGLGDIVTATFTEARETVVIHSLASAVVVLACLTMFFVVGAVLWRAAPGWHGFGVFSVVAGLVFLVLSVLLYLRVAPTSPLAALHIGGLSERVVIFWRDLWYAVLGWQFFKSAASADAAAVDDRDTRFSPHGRFAG